MAVSTAPYIITPEQVATFGNLTGDPHPLHRDPILAAQAGLRGTPVMGAYLVAHVLAERRRAGISEPVTHVDANFSEPIYADQSWSVEQQTASGYKGVNGHQCFDLVVGSDPILEPYKEPRRLVAGPIEAPLIIGRETIVDYNALMGLPPEAQDESFAAALFPGAFVRTLMHAYGERTIAYNHSAHITFRAPLQPRPASIDLRLTRTMDKVHRLEGRLVQDGIVCANAILMAAVPNPLDMERLKAVKEIPKYTTSSAA